MSSNPTVFVKSPEEGIARVKEGDDEIFEIIISKEILKLQSTINFNNKTFSIIESAKIFLVAYFKLNLIQISKEAMLIWSRVQQMSM